MSIDSGESVEPMKLANVCAFVGVVRMKKLDLLMGMRKQGFRTNIECRRPGGAFHEGFGDPTLCNGRRTFSNFSGSLINAPFFFAFFRAARLSFWPHPPGVRPCLLSAQRRNRRSWRPCGTQNARRRESAGVGEEPLSQERRSMRPSLQDTLSHVGDCFKGHF